MSTDVIGIFHFLQSQYPSANMTLDVPIDGTLKAVKQLEEYLGIDLCTDITEGYSGRTKL